MAAQSDENWFWILRPKQKCHHFAGHRDKLFFWIFQYIHSKVYLVLLMCSHHLFKPLAESMLTYMQFIGAHVCVTYLKCVKLFIYNSGTILDPYQILKTWRQHSRSTFPNGVTPAMPNGRNCARSLSWRRQNRHNWRHFRSTSHNSQTPRD